MMRRYFAVLLSAVLITTQTGCLGTLVQSPVPPGLTHSTTQVHIVTLPTRVDAAVCRNGLSEVFTRVPLWGLVAGFFTFGIIIPTTTEYSCTAGT